MNDSAWPFDPLPRAHFRCILADPPWSFTTYSAKGKGKSPERHYSTMTLADINALPVRELAHPDGCACLMWATSPMLDQQIRTLTGWGFRYVGFVTWGKQSRTGTKLHMGTGYWYRQASEIALLGIVGKPKRLSRGVRNFILAPVREHSRKPDQMRADLETLWPGPRCELFSRTVAPGWSAWGNQTDRFAA
jgi:N6-adenosine-specific RNA methylase IME4